uniref:Death domain-containing protein n=1 Tax=Ascaris lumbricoides TaxID=6252 RepID=A0A0M3IIP5_ASCLU
MEEQFFSNEEDVLGPEDEAQVSDEANAAKAQLSKDFCFEVEKCKSWCATGACNQLEEVIGDVQDILVEELSDVPNIADTVRTAFQPWSEKFSAWQHELSKVTQVLVRLETEKETPSRGLAAAEKYETIAKAFGLT